MTLKDIYMSGIFNDDTLIKLTVNTEDVCKITRGKWYEDKMQTLFVAHKNALIDNLSFLREPNLLEVEVTA